MNARILEGPDGRIPDAPGFRAWYTYPNDNREPKMIRRTLLAATIFTMPAAHALACSDVTSVMAHFENVKDAYLEAAPNMKPEQFPIWAGHLEGFSAAMSAQDFAGACQALDDAAAELAFNVAPAPTSVVAGGGGGGTTDSDSTTKSSDTAAAAAASGTTSGSNVPIGSGVTVGSGVTIGSGSASGSDASAGALTSASGEPVRTRARPVRWRIGG